MNREAITEILRAIVVIGIITAAIFIGAAHSLDDGGQVPVLLYHPPESDLRRRPGLRTD